MFFTADDGVYGREFWKLSPAPGDANFDGDVGLRDLAILQNNFGRSGDNLPGDLTGDGRVDRADLSSLVQSLGSGATGSASPSAAVATQLAHSQDRAYVAHRLTSARDVSTRLPSIGSSWGL